MIPMMVLVLKPPPPLLEELGVGVEDVIGAREETVGFGEEDDGGRVVGVSVEEEEEKDGVLPVRYVRRMMCNTSP